MRKAEKVAPLTARLVAKGRAKPAGGSMSRPLVIVKPTPAGEERKSHNSKPARASAPGHTEPRDSKPARASASRHTDRRHRVSLRVDKQRHLKLRLLAAHLRRSVQDVLTVAIDLHLDQAAELIGLGKCVCLDRDGVSSGCSTEACSRGGSQR